MRTDIDKVYDEYADWQSRMAHSRSVPMVRKIMSAIDVAKKNIIEDMEEIIDHFRSECGFKDRAEAIWYLSQPVDAKTRSILRESVDKIEDPDKKRKMLHRINGIGETREMLSNRKALYMTVENTITDTSAKVNGVMQKGLSAILKTSSAQAMYTMQRGCRAGWSFGMPNKRQIAVLMKRVYDPTFSFNFVGDYIASTKDILIGGVTSGTPVRRIAQQIEETTGQELWKAKRFVRTEITRAGNVGESYALQSAGIEKYEYSCTLDERTCPVCGALDGKTFSLDDAEEGVNYPPMHPNCRCWHHAVLNRSIKEKMTRAHRNPETGKTDYVPMTMTYEAWKEKYLTDA